MNEFTVLCAVVALVGLFVTMEIVSAVLPLVLVITLVPPGDRAGLAQVIAAADSSRKLRLWSALRVAVAARGRTRSGGADTATPRPGFAPGRHSEGHAWNGRAFEASAWDDQTVGGHAPHGRTGDVTIGAGVSGRWPGWRR
ncbi:hypothetical protein [Actinoplanes sp. NPDC049265]|uniref:hypothetical protein n=1 Tax=Actinoplanes sp. NPDC049265 TaxID=3363902 RepID=UPI00370F9BE3